MPYPINTPPKFYDGRVPPTSIGDFKIRGLIHKIYATMALLEQKPALSTREGALRTREDILADESVKISRAHEVMSILAEQLLGQESSLATYEGNAYVPSAIIEQVYEKL